MRDQLTIEEQQVVRRTIARIHEKGWGIAFGSLFAIGLIAATNILILRGGEVVGPHLSLLRWYFPGYSVTFAGSLIGAVYAFVLGYGLGRSVAAIYNRLARRLH